MKLLEITPEVDKFLAQALDALLKKDGFLAYPAVTEIMKSIKDQE